MSKSAGHRHRCPVCDWTWIHLTADWRGGNETETTWNLTCPTCDETCDPEIRDLIQRTN